ncbi:MAG: hypothetical protein PHV91_02185 [Bacteroidales bacterium]|jgi:hypothetical protein|nr:hypothetical protein [Bacteroidales bacterium]MDD3299631.1 hypothetical protein [Bacteroidales bacterium]MDD3843237.1 hypothetical protein [Bacteroidales bacterium]MDD4618046.1 hypothetical protein [Bacteroidales bacterium]
MKTTTIATILIACLILGACSKNNIGTTPEWNALSFTESENEEYSSYMNQPYVNLTFPGIVQGNSINFLDGKWEYGGIDYILVPHNWIGGKLKLQLVKNGALDYEHELDLTKPISLEIPLSKGEYSFKASLMDERGETLLNTYPLHGGTNKMIVE